VPEQWGQIDIFATFFASSFPGAKPIERRAVSGVGNHFRKAMVLRSLSLRIKPTLAIDKQQLNQKGYTRSISYTTQESTPGLFTL
jgi:hypothetical protein